MARRIFLRQITVLLSAIIAIGAVALGAGLAVGQHGEAPSVRLVIDYGSGVEKHFTRIAHRPGITVFEAMRAARELPEPLGLRFEHTGSGERVFVRSIDGLANQGAGENHRNWTYEVNGEGARVGCGARTLARGDVVRWRFGPYNMGDD